jgi:hypothetical protein
VDLFVIEDRARDRRFERIVVVAPDEDAARRLAAPIAASECSGGEAKDEMRGRWLSPGFTTAKALGVASGDPAVVLADFGGPHRTTYADDEAARSAAGTTTVYRLAIPSSDRGGFTPHVVVRAPDEATAREVASERGVSFLTGSREETAAWLDLAGIECTPVSLAEAHVVYGDRVG